MFFRWKTQPSSGHTREKRPYPSSYYTIRGRMSGMFVSEKPFHYQVRNVLRHWWLSWCPTSNDLSDILLSCSWVCVYLDSSTCSGLNPEGTCRFIHPRARAADLGHGPHTVRATELRLREKPARPEGKQVPKCRKNTFIPVSYTHLTLPTKA